MMRVRINAHGLGLRVAKNIVKDAKCTWLRRRFEFEWIMILVRSCGHRLGNQLFYRTNTLLNIIYTNKHKLTFMLFMKVSLILHFKASFQLNSFVISFCFQSHLLFNRIHH